MIQRQLRDISLTMQLCYRRVEREGKAEKDYRYRQDEAVEARRTQVLEWLPDWGTKGRERTREALGVMGQDESEALGGDGTGRERIIDENTEHHIHTVQIHMLAKVESNLSNSMAVASAGSSVPA